MLESYDDIRRRIPEPPKWFDEHGVPRYDDFHPMDSPNVYADEVVLYEIACQACDERFLVEENWGRLDSLIQRRDITPLSQAVRDKAIHYGDPPAHSNCLAGATMNCIDKKTVQFWTRQNDDREWVRVPELEGVDIEPEWASAEETA